MQTKNLMCVGSAMALTVIAGGGSASAASATDLDEVRQQLLEMRTEYEARIAELERRLARAERDADKAYELAEETAIAATTPRAAPNVYNPAIGAVLVASHADVNSAWEDIPGFASGGELGPGESGFSLGESEINLKAAIDPLFFGNLTLALEDEDGETEVGVEEAWVQATALPWGLNALAGRFFSGVGYLNKFHRHADDFADRPLPYAAFFGGQYIEDGVQLRWVAPTELFVEIGTELNWGDRFPARDSGGTSPDAWTLFAHIGGDVGASHSWQAGVSYLSFDIDERSVGEPDPGDPPGLFSGDSDIVGLDFVWKWAPGGNPTVRNVKLQGEFFYREEDGRLDALPYDGDQDGWYLQGVWQFAPRWRIGYRHDEVDSDNGAALIGTPLEDPDHTPRRDTVMVDWSYSEFSRIRLQYAHDRVVDDGEDQWLVQYIMSVGAHGAHEF